MKVYTHYTVASLSNTYLIGPDHGGEAILVDPGSFDGRLLELIEGNKYYLSHILITHVEENHVSGLKTLKKIYDAEIHAAGTRQLYSFPCAPVQSGQTVKLGEFDVEAIGVPAHTRDSLMYRIGHMIFAGDVFSAGVVGDVPNPYARALLVETVREQLHDFPPHTVIFPCHGPPTTWAIERASNPDITSSAGDEGAQASL